MKVTIDKKTVTLAQVTEARELIANEAEWIDKESLVSCANAIIRNYLQNESAGVKAIIKMPELSVTVNHYKLTIYANDMWIICWTGEGDMIARVCFDFMENICGNVEAFVETYVQGAYGTC